MDPRRLMTFRAVAHARSFSRAAETDVADAAVGVASDRPAGDRDRRPPARARARRAAPDGRRRGAARTRGPRRVAPRARRHAARVARRPAPRTRPGRCVPDCPRGLRAVRGRAAAARTSRPPGPARRGHAEHARSALPRRRVRRRHQLPGRHHGTPRAQRRRTDRPHAGHIPDRSAAGAPARRRSRPDLTDRARRRRLDRRVHERASSSKPAATPDSTLASWRPPASRSPHAV